MRDPKPQPVKAPSGTIYPYPGPDPMRKKRRTKMAKKLYGAAAKAHAKKGGRKAPKTRKAVKSSGGMIHHKAYSYKNKEGKIVHVAAHSERRR